MRNYSIKSYGAAIAGLTGLVAHMVLAPSVEASDPSARRNIRPVAAHTAFDPHHQSILRLSERDAFPLHRSIKIGRNKSLMIEVPHELRDVIVSSPDIVDAVVQSSNRVYLIGKKFGQANIDKTMALVEERTRTLTDFTKDQQKRNEWADRILARLDKE